MSKQLIEAGVEFAWHYTTGQIFKAIADRGMLLTENETTPEAIIPGLLGGVWFSLRQDYEPTACKRIIFTDGRTRRGTWEETIEMGGGAVRIGVAVDAPFLLTWNGYRDRCTCEKKYIRQLRDVALMRGSNVHQFRVSLTSVPRAHWMAVETLKDGKWKPVEV